MWRIWKCTTLRPPSGNMNKTQKYTLDQNHSLTCVTSYWTLRCHFKDHKHNLEPSVSDSMFWMWRHKVIFELFSKNAHVYSFPSTHLINSSTLNTLTLKYTQIHVIVAFLKQQHWKHLECNLPSFYWICLFSLTGVVLFIRFPCVRFDCTFTLFNAFV